MRLTALTLRVQPMAAAAAVLIPGAPVVAAVVAVSGRTAVVVVGAAVVAVTSRTAVVVVVVAAVAVTRDLEAALCLWATHRRRRRTPTCSRGWHGSHWIRTCPRLPHSA